MVALYSKLQRYQGKSKVKPAPVRGGSDRKKQASVGERWYARDAQTEKTELTMVHQSPFKSMVPVMRGLGTGGIL